MFEWLNGEGAILKHHIPGSTNYLTNLKDRNASAASEEKSARDHSANAGGSEEGALSDVGGNKPFPLNPSFVSESILSEELRNGIYDRVVVQKMSVRAVSVELGVDMKRVAAVVRLVELETRWRKEVCSPELYFSFSPLIDPGPRIKSLARLR